MRFKSLVISGLILYFTSSGYSHIPQWVEKNTAVQENPVIIENPAVSKAFYGELTGKTNYFQFTLTKPLNFYLNILVPDITGFNQNRFSVNLKNISNLIILTLDGYQTRWKPFYEPFGQDNYLMGPEAHIQLTNGKYVIEVFNNNNTGRYCLATGEKEWFGLLEIIQTINIMPRLKKEFFNKTN